MFGLTKKNNAATFLGYFSKTSEFSPNSDGKVFNAYMKKLEPGECLSISCNEASDFSNLICILEGEIECSVNDTKSYLNTHEHLLINSYNTEISIQASDFVTLLLIFSSLNRKLLDVNLDSLKEIIDEFSLRDFQTFEHCKRVRKYSLLIAEKLELSGERIATLAFSSLLHDIGKSSVPEAVLKKDSMLTEDEFEILKNHPLTGRKLLEGILPQQVGKTIEQHHERPDGSGYPFGLIDQDISIEAKIICVVDSYDAMTTDRPYHKAIEPKEAISELKELSGRYYNYEIVTTFEKCLNEMKILA